ncbi:MAG: complex I subunit 1 family protein [Actinomycetota bacterium]
MRASASPAVAVVVVGALMAAGVYVVAVLDRLVASVVASRRPAWSAALAAPAAAAALLVMQRRRSTERPDAVGWALAPALLAGLAAVALAMVPFAPDLSVADPATGFVIFAAAIAFVMIAVFLHGWSPNSALPLLGAYRYGAQGLSLQMPFLLAMLATALPAESLAITDIVEAQRSLWNVVRQPLGLPLYAVVGVGVAFWGPLNLPDGADIAGGTTVESSGAALLAWEVARAGMLVAVAAMGAAVFLGGWWGPWLPGPVWMLVKTLMLVAVLVGTGHLLARVRIEPFVVVAWAVLIPSALVNVFVAGATLL